MEGANALQKKQPLSKNSSRYRGVTRHRRTRRWEAHLWDDKKQIYLGGFDDEARAGEAHDIMALKCRGTVGTALNFPLANYTALLPYFGQQSKEDVITRLRGNCRTTAPSLTHALVEAAARDPPPSRSPPREAAAAPGGLDPLGDPLGDGGTPSSSEPLSEAYVPPSSVARRKKRRKTSRPQAAYARSSPEREEQLEVSPPPKKRRRSRLPSSDAEWEPQGEWEPREREREASRGRGSPRGAPRGGAAAAAARAATPPHLQGVVLGVPLMKMDNDRLVYVIAPAEDEEGDPPGASPERAASRGGRLIKPTPRKLKAPKGAGSQGSARRAAAPTLFTPPLARPGLAPGPKSMQRTRPRTQLASKEAGREEEALSPTLLPPGVILHSARLASPSLLGAKWAPLASPTTLHAKPPPQALPSPRAIPLPQQGAHDRSGQPQLDVTFFATGTAPAPEGTPRGDAPEETPRRLQDGPADDPAPDSSPGEAADPRPTPPLAAISPPLGLRARPAPGDTPGGAIPVPGGAPGGAFSAWGAKGPRQLIRLQPSGSSPFSAAALSGIALPVASPQGLPMASPIPAQQPGEGTPAPPAAPAALEAAPSQEITLCTHPLGDPCPSSPEDRKPVVQELLSQTGLLPGSPPPSGAAAEAGAVLVKSPDSPFSPVLQSLRGYDHAAELRRGLSLELIC